MKRPDPLTPPGCDMAGNDWFPLHFRRLRTSKWWRRASDLARARNIFLWGEAYAAVPAGSLADDDDELAEAAGFGFDVDAWLAAKAEIMAPWVLCSDGRWYHPTVCEVVLDAWDRQSDRRKKAAVKKAEQRARARGVAPKTAIVPLETENVPGDTAEKGGDKTTQTLQTGQDSKDADASLSSVETKNPKYPEPFEAIWKAYPHSKGRSSKPKTLGQWRRIPPARRNLLPAAIARYARDGREPKADCGAPAMERWLNDERFLDWMEDASPQETARPVFDGPPELRAWIVAATDEGFAASYLDHCRWDQADRRLIARNSFHAGKLRTECAAVLARARVTVTTADQPATQEHAA